MHRARLGLRAMGERGIIVVIFSWGEDRVIEGLMQGGTRYFCETWRAVRCESIHGVGLFPAR